MSRITHLVSAAVTWLPAIACCLHAVPAHAQGADWPKQPVKVVVGFPPGGGNDILARTFGQKLAEQLKQPFVIENKPGANGFIAAEQVARAAPDGYTLLLGPSGSLTFSPAVYAKMPYDAQKSFDPIAILGRFPLVVIVNADLGINSISELVAWAKANPAKANYGSTSPAFQLPTELFMQKTGMKAEHIKFKGSADKATAVATGEITFAFIDPGPTAPHVKSGKVRVLATTGAKRTMVYPEVPTLAETGVAGIDVQIFGGLLAPKGTPAAIVKRLEAEVDIAAKAPDLVERLRTLNIPVSDIRAQGFTELIAREIPLWTEVARSANIKLE